MAGSAAEFGRGLLEIRRSGQCGQRVPPDSVYKSKHADALRYLAAVAIEQRNAGEAREIMSKLGSVEQPSPELQYNFGLLLQSTGDHGAAADCYRATLQHKPEFTAAMVNLGHALKAVGREEEARSVWSQAVAADPTLAAKYIQ